jgi:hypothetical protein
MTPDTRIRMKRIASALTLVTLNLATGAARAEEALQPFTHVAQIPADSDAGSIRFQKAKMVQIPTTITYTANPEYCKESAFRDPGGSMYCSFARTGTPATAYELTFSFTGSPLASDEFGNRNFTFTVYLRPDELPPDMRQAISAISAISRDKRSRSDIAGSFKMSTSREPVQKIVVDEAETHFCAGNFLDGSWTANDASCKDEVHYKALAVPSDYVTVRIDPSPVRAGLASANKAAAAIASNQ